MTLLLCHRCGTRLSADEAHHYGNACEDCIRDAWDRLGAWRDGRDDPGLDLLFDASQPARVVQ